MLKDRAAEENMLVQNVLGKENRFCSNSFNFAFSLFRVISPKCLITLAPKLIAPKAL